MCCSVFFSIPPTPPPRPLQIQASLLACEGLSGVCLVPTVASKKMMPKQSSKQAEGRERGSSPDVLVRRGGSGLGGVTPWGGRLTVGFWFCVPRHCVRMGRSPAAERRRRRRRRRSPKSPLKRQVGVGGEGWRALDEGLWVGG